MSELTKSPRIFVVHDEEILASTLVAILRNQGYDVLFFTEPLKALAGARVNGPDLLITDVKMPTMSGIELAVQFQKLRSGCMILLFAGMGSMDMVEASRLGGDTFEVLLKPVHPLELIKQVERMVGTGPWLADIAPSLVAGPGVPGGLRLR